MKDHWMEVGGSPCVVSMPDDYGQARVNGQVWRWDWHNYLGPIFLNKDGSDKKRQPGPKHPVWRAVARWQKKRKL
jgi:hypothetical protein